MLAPPSEICFPLILFLIIIFRHSQIHSSLKSCLSVYVFSLLGSFPFLTKGLYYDSEFSRIHLPFCFSRNRKHLTVRHVSMSKALLFKLHFLIVSLKFCWFEIHRRNFRSIKDLFLPLKKVISAVSFCDTERKSEKEQFPWKTDETSENKNKTKQIQNPKIC